MLRFRRPVCIAALTCAIAVPALAGCEAGFNAPTLTFHPAAFGGYATQDGIMIDNAFVLGSTTGVTVPRAPVEGFSHGALASLPPRLRTSLTAARANARSPSGGKPATACAGGAATVPVTLASPFLSSRLSS